MALLMRRLAALFMALVCLAACAAAEERICVRVYAADTMDAGTAEQLVRLLDGAFPQAEWTLEKANEGGLRALVMDDRAPDIALCAPGEMMPWAKEGLLLPLDGRIVGASRIQREALEPGVWAERLYAVPLFARHRRMAVNADRVAQLQMDSLLDAAAYPVWQPAQLERLLEEMYLAEETGMDVWPVKENGDAVMAFAQALYGGAWLGEDGGVHTGDPAAILGAGWLGEMVQDGVIGLQESRGAALDRFLEGETAVFIDWTDAEARRFARLEGDAPFALMEMPYPSAEGVPVRSFELTDACAFDSGDREKNALLCRAVAFLHEQAAETALAGDGGVRRDGAIWLRPWDANERGATIRSLAVEALDAVLAGKADAKTAFAAVQAAVEASGL